MNFFDQLGKTAACVSDPFGCTISWLDTVPALYLITFGLVVGAVLGAAIGWKGLAVVGTLGAVVFFAGRRSADPAHEHVDGADASTPFRRTPRKPLKPSPDHPKTHRTFNPDTGLWE